MQGSADILECAKWHLSEQEKRIRQQEDFIKDLSEMGSIHRQRSAKEVLLQMQRAAGRLRHEVDALEAFEIVRKRAQANRLHA